MNADPIIGKRYKTAQGQYRENVGGFNSMVITFQSMLEYGTP